MSDFLGRLAARSLGSMPGIETRPQSLFATVMDATVPEENLAETTADTAFSHLKAAPAVVAINNDEPPVETHMHHPARGERGELAQANHEARANRESSHGEYHAHEPIRPLVHPSPATNETHPQPHAPRVSESRMQVAASMHVSALDEETKQGVHKSSLQQSWRSLVPGHKPDASATKPAPMADIAPASAEPAAPAIHITIGRVEVRAQVAAPPAPAPRPKPQSKPSLSLDDYLKRGGGGS